MAVGDIMQVRIVAYRSNQIAVNIRHWRVSAVAGTQLSEQLLADNFNTQFAAAWKAIINANASYRGVGVRRIFPLPAGIEFYNVSSDGVGGVAGDPLPGQCAGVITLNTALAGRANRGRVFAPWPSEGDNTVAGVPSAGYVANLVTVGGKCQTTYTFVSGANSTTLVPVIFHRRFFTVSDIIGGTARNKWGTQRRRGDYGRTNQLPF